MYPRIPSLLLICGFCTSRLRSAEQARWVRRHRDTRAVRTRRPQHVQNTRGLREKRGPATVSAPQASQNPSCLFSRAIRTGATFPATVEQRESLSESALFSAPFLLEPSLSLPIRSRGLSMESSTSCAFLPHMPVPGGGRGGEGVLLLALPSPRWLPTLCLALSYSLLSTCTLLHTSALGKAAATNVPFHVCFSAMLLKATFSLDGVPPSYFDPNLRHPEKKLPLGHTARASETELSSNRIKSEVLSPQDPLAGGGGREQKFYFYLL